MGSYFGQEDLTVELYLASGDHGTPGVLADIMSELVELEHANETVE